MPHRLLPSTGKSTGVKLFIFLSLAFFLLSMIEAKNIVGTTETFLPLSKLGFHPGSQSLRGSRWAELYREEVH